MTPQELLQAVDAETDMAERDEKIDALITAVGNLGRIVRELKSRVNFLEGQLVDTPDPVRQAEDYEYSNTTGSNNSFSGSSSGRNNTTGGSNSFTGASSGRNNTTGSNNIGIDSPSVSGPLSEVI